MCGYSGAAVEFVKGCPKCGQMNLEKGSVQKREKQPKKGKGLESLPWWVFLVADIVLGGIILMIILYR